MGQVVPMGWEPRDMTELLYEKAEDSENTLGDPGALKAPASLGATPEEAQVFLGGLQGPWGKGGFGVAEMMVNSQKGIPKGLGCRQPGEPCSPAPAFPDSALLAEPPSK